MSSDSGFGVQTRNTFDLLDEDAPAKQSKPKEVKEEPKKDAKRTSDRDRPNPRVEGGDRRVDGGERGRGGGGARGARGGRGRGGGGRGGGGGGGEGGRERKEFDAHISRSGKTREPKKEGAGKFNEGSVRDVIADGTSEDRRRHPRRRKDEEGEVGATTETKEGDATTTDAPADGAEEPKDKVTTIADEIEPEEPATRSYDQFLASKPKLDSDLAIQRREVQNDESQFKAVKVIAKNEEKNPYITASSAEEKEKAPKTKKDKAKHISFDEFISTGNNGTKGQGSFRGRGGRGGRGRGDARSLAVTETNFPALGAKEKK